ncbi:PAS domain-containing sensor histidine kinase [Pseudomonas sp. ICMP 561]|uniref:PAS domain-containing sensor histidine kinase n=1 Tax=Pseudomonas sp. ICMP 561 TaxID=1718918 RepID=UPI000C0985DB|nr:PAS domain-containing sensor histidine kinase [Pseudomonas sp. ICMP 561]PHN20493.1 histidine kinase [Pseudomonas sp. ICMP 561]
MPVDVELSADSDLLFEGAACGLLLTREDGTILRANLTFCLWMGSDSASLAGTRFQDLMSVGDKIFQQTHWGPLLEMRGSVSEIKLDLVRHDGHAMTMMLNAIRRETPQGVVHHLSIMSGEERNKYQRELAETRQAAEEMLLQQLASQKELSSVQNRLRMAQTEADIRATFAEQMVAIVSHDLRNPLAAIKMAAGLIGLEPLSDKQQRSLGLVNQSVGRAQRLIVDLLDFTQARVGSGISVLPQPVQLHEVIAASVAEQRLLFPRRVLIHECIGDGLCTADADRLFELVDNLVSNAVAYGSATGVITITSAFDAQWIRIAVHNVGPPIPPDRLDGLFEPMPHGVADDDPSRSIGLGLFIVREIARAHWGDVSVTSTAEQGTTFTINLARPVS